MQTANTCKANVSSFHKNYSTIQIQQRQVHGGDSFINSLPTPVSKQISISENATFDGVFGQCAARHQLSFVFQFLRKLLSFLFLFSSNASLIQGDKSKSIKIN